MSKYDRPHVTDLVFREKNTDVSSLIKTYIHAKEDEKIAPALMEHFQLNSGVWREFNTPYLPPEENRTFIFRTETDMDNPEDAEATVSIWRYHTRQPVCALTTVIDNRHLIDLMYTYRGLIAVGIATGADEAARTHSSVMLNDRDFTDSISGIVTPQMIQRLRKHHPDTPIFYNHGLKNHDGDFEYYDAGVNYGPYPHRGLAVRAIDINNYRVGLLNLDDTWKWHLDVPMNMMIGQDL